MAVKYFRSAEEKKGYKEEVGYNNIVYHFSLYSPLSILWAVRPLVSMCPSVVEPFGSPCFLTLTL